MTSIPKPLKFLRPHYAKLKESFEKVSDADNKVLDAHTLAELTQCSVLSRTFYPWLA